MRITYLVAGCDLELGDAITVKDGVAMKIPPVSCTMTEFEETIIKVSDGCAIEKIKANEAGKFILLKEQTDKPHRVIHTSFQS